MLKSKFKYNDLKTILKLCSKYKRGLYCSVLFSILNTLLVCITPRLISDVVNSIQDSIVSGLVISDLKKRIIVIICVCLASYLFALLQGRLIARITQSVSGDLRHSVIGKINTISMKSYNMDRNGEILSLISNDVDLIGQALNQSVSTFISAVFLFVGSLIMMFIESRILTVFTFLSTLAGLMLMYIIVKRTQRYFKLQQDFIAEINGIVDETYSGADTVKLYNAERSFIDKFSKVNKSIRSCSWKAQYFSGMMMPLMAFVANLGYVAVCIAGGMLVFKGIIKLGVIVAFMLYIKNFTEPLSQISQAVSNFQQAAAASMRVSGFLKKDNVSKNTAQEDSSKIYQGMIEFDNVYFGYSDDKLLFNKLSFKIEPGQQVAFVGHTGSGKTTISNLLLRFYDISSGRILIDDADLKSISRKNIHKIFSFVSQDIWLFEGTVTENIAYGKDDLDEDKVIELCKKIGIHNMICSLPEEYNTVINDESVVSKGQKQLITIARAVLDDAPILLMDEATSNVDTRLEMIVQNALDKIMEDKTTIIFAHRLSTLKNSDRIVVLDHGTIVETGTHDDLMKKNGHYALIYNSQFGDGQDLSYE